MSEPTEGATPSRAAAAPGITALFAAAEAGWAYQAAYLKRFSEYQRRALIALHATAGHYVSRDAVIRAAGKRVANQITTLWLLDLLERQGAADAYRLTPFGQTVAAALAGEG